MRRLGLILAAAVAAAAPSAALAGALRVSPVGLDLPAERPAATLTLRNDDARPMAVQVRVFRWTQSPEGDRLEPTEDVVASPPMASLAAKGEQVVRLVRLAPAQASEASYRVFVDELPPPPSERGRAVQLLMRHSIPVFFGTAGPHAPETAWSVERTADGARLVGVNAGDRRLRIAAMKLFDAQGRVVGEHAGLLGYVLAKASVSWEVALTAPAARPVRMTAETDLGPIDIALRTPL